MKPHPKIAAVLALLLFVSPLSMAQGPGDCQHLENKIEALKATIEALKAKAENKDLPDDIRAINDRALAHLYVDLLACLDRKIAIVTEIKNTVAGTNAFDAVDKELKKFLDKRAEFARDLAKVTGTNLSNTSASNSTPQSDSPGNGSHGGSASNAGSTPGSADTPATPQTDFPCLPGEAYADAPPLLTDIVVKTADGVVKNENNGALSGIPEMMLYTTIDATSPTSSNLVRILEPYQYLSETARTDKQLGGAANSNGAVGAIEKPGFASLLGFAVEHGAINKEKDGTNLTLSTSLYSLYVLGKENTAKTYQSAGVLNRIGASATFAMENTTDDLANARRNNLSEWSVKARLFGDRSTRSKEFQKFWNENVVPAIDRRLRAIGQPLEVLTSGDDAPKGYKHLRTQGGNCLRDAVRKRTAEADYLAADSAGRTKMLTDLLLSLLRSNVYNRITGGEIVLDDKLVTLIEKRYVPNLKAALDDLTRVGGLIEEKLKELKASPLGTFAYTNFRIPTGSDYSETKFLFEQDKGFMGPLKLIGNVGLSFYHRPDPLLNQDRMRDFSAALSFEGSSNSPFTEAENQARITYSFVGRYQRLFENRRVLGRTADIGTLQFVTEVPLFKGLSIPFSVTYSSATEEEKKQGFRFNFGTRLDMDKLLELVRATSKL